MPIILSASKKHYIFPLLINYYKEPTIYEFANHKFNLSFASKNLN